MAEESERFAHSAEICIEQNIHKVWRSIRERLRLNTDTELAALLIEIYGQHEGRDLDFSIRCPSCHSGLKLLCPSCFSKASHELGKVPLGEDDKTDGKFDSKQSDGEEERGTLPWRGSDLRLCLALHQEGHGQTAGCVSPSAADECPEEVMTSVTQPCIELGQLCEKEREGTREQEYEEAVGELRREEVIEDTQENHQEPKEFFVELIKELASERQEMQGYGDQVPALQTGLVVEAKTNKKEETKSNSVKLDKENESLGYALKMPLVRLMRIDEIISFRFASRQLEKGETQSNSCRTESLSDPVLIQPKPLSDPVSIQLKPLSDPVSNQSEPLSDPVSVQSEPQRDPLSIQIEPLCDPVSIQSEPLGDHVSIQTEPLCDLVSIRTEPLSDPVSIQSEPLCDPVSIQSEPLCDPVSIQAEPLCDAVSIQSDVENLPEETHITTAETVGIETPSENVSLPTQGCLEEKTPEPESFTYANYSSGSQQMLRLEMPARIKCGKVLPSASDDASPTALVTSLGPAAAEEPRPGKIADCRRQLDTDTKASARLEHPERPEPRQSDTRRRQRRKPEKPRRLTIQFFQQLSQRLKPVTVERSKEEQSKTIAMSRQYGCNGSASDINTGLSSLKDVALTDSQKNVSSTEKEMSLSESNSQQSSLNIPLTKLKDSSEKKPGISQSVSVDKPDGRIDCSIKQQHVSSINHQQAILKPSEQLQPRDDQTDVVGQCVVESRMVKGRKRGKKSLRRQPPPSQQRCQRLQQLDQSQPLCEKHTTSSMAAEGGGHPQRCKGRKRQIDCKVTTDLNGLAQEHMQHSMAKNPRLFSENRNDVKRLSIIEKKITTKKFNGKKLNHEISSGATNKAENNITQQVGLMLADLTNETSSRTDSTVVMTDEDRKKNRCSRSDNKVNNVEKYRLDKNESLNDHKVITESANYKQKIDGKSFLLLVSDGPRMNKAATEVDTQGAVIREASCKGDKKPLAEPVLSLQTRSKKKKETGKIIVNTKQFDTDRIQNKLSKDKHNIKMLTEWRLMGHNIQVGNYKNTEETRILDPTDKVSKRVISLTEKKTKLNNLRRKDAKTEDKEAFIEASSKMLTKLKDAQASKRQKRHPCRLCGKHFPYPSDVQRHMVTHREKPRRRYVCDQCGKEFKNAQILCQHRVTHTDQRPFQCRFCPRACKRKADLRVHEKRHLGELTRKHRCDLCGETFLSRSHLRQHMTSHTGVKDYRCSVCHKAFVQQSNLKMHMFIHTDTRNFACPVCKRAFKQKADMQKHERTHTQKKDFACPHCEKAFIRSDQLKQHLVTHAEDRSRSYQCRLCSQGFFDKSALKKHERLHGREKAHVCGVCAKHFTHHYQLIRHSQIHEESNSQGTGGKTTTATTTGEAVSEEGGERECLPF